MGLIDFTTTQRLEVPATQVTYGPARAVGYTFVALATASGTTARQS